MTSTRKYAAVLAAALAGATAAAFIFVLVSRAQLQTPGPLAQTQPTSTMNRNVVFIDPAHGGGDGGAVLGDHIFEKDVTLEMAAKLHASLTVAGFTVVSTRDSDTFNPPTNDQRAEMANRSRAVACIVLHATASGTGVHLYTSALQPPADVASDSASSTAFVPTPWETAQAGSVRQSLQLASTLRTALASTSLPVVVGRGSIRPLDNMMCPAVAVEVAPQTAATSVTDADYQQNIAAKLTSALQTWRDQSAPLGAQSATTGVGSQTFARTHSADATKAAARAMAVAEAAGQTAARYHTVPGGRGVTQTHSRSQPNESDTSRTEALPRPGFAFIQ